MIRALLLSMLLIATPAAAQQVQPPDQRIKAMLGQLLYENAMLAAEAEKWRAHAEALQKQLDELRAAPPKPSQPD